MSINIGIAASEGGHLSEAFFLKKVYEQYDFFVISYQSLRVERLPCRKYMVPPFTRNVLNILPTLWIVFRAFLKERPDVVISTGAEIAIPVFLLAKLFRIRTVFIETIVAFEKPSLTGKLMYPLADKFYVQNEETLGAMGKRAEYHGGII